MTDEISSKIIDLLDNPTSERAIEQDEISERGESIRERVERARRIVEEENRAREGRPKRPVPADTHSRNIINPVMQNPNDDLIKSLRLEVQIKNEPFYKRLFHGDLYKQKKVLEEKIRHDKGYAEEGELGALKAELESRSWLGWFFDGLNGDDHGLYKRNRLIWKIKQLEKKRMGNIH